MIMNTDDSQIFMNSFTSIAAMQQQMLTSNFLGQLTMNETFGNIASTTSTGGGVGLRDRSNSSEVSLADWERIAICGITSNDEQKEINKSLFYNPVIADDLDDKVGVCAMSYQTASVSLGMTNSPPQQ